MRKRIVAGNWKMNKSLAEGALLVDELLSAVEVENTTVILIPPFTHLDRIVELTEENNSITVGAQNCHWEASGAYTGEVSAAMLNSLGVNCCLVGHSERRMYFHESDEQLLQKTKQLLANGITPIFCCGEGLEERKGGLHFKTVEQQLKDGLFNLTQAEIEKVVIAYEPVWAIGTGETASPEQAQEMHAFIRDLVKEHYQATVAEALPILYGGSCKPDNAASLFACADVDGGLIGGASLVAEDFRSIIAIAES